MKTFHFILWLEGRGPLSQEIEDQLFEAGCDDALVGSFHDRPFLEFDREAATLLAAVTSALRDVKKLNLIVDHIGLYEFVTASEIARRTNRTRASVSQLISGERGPGDFPDPFQPADPSPLWLWPDVEAWLARYEGKEPADATASELRKINTAYQLVRRIPDRDDRNRLLEELAST
jgi:hypothetical protein